MYKPRSIAFISALLLSITGLASLELHAAEAITRPLRLPPSQGNPRNSEGDFIELEDGRVMFIYSHFFGGGGDHDQAKLVARVSSDGGATWTQEDQPVLGNEGGWNVMSVSLMRLASGEIALFYCRKNSLNDCRPYMRISTDEAKTWGEARLCITDKVGYYVLNNDRAVQLKSGRIVLPVCLHNEPGDAQPDWMGHLMCYYSDDLGQTWRRSQSVMTGTDAKGSRLTVQEPGVIELKDGGLMMYIRCSGGSRFVSYSQDGGDTWSPPGPSKMISPLSPATIKRIPKTGDLLLAWNNHENVDDLHRGKRTPFCVAISRDEGQNWEQVKTIEDDPNGWYCYTAIEFVGDHVLLGHCAGHRPTGGLAVTQITRFSVDWLYEQAK